MADCYYSTQILNKCYFGIFSENFAKIGPKLIKIHARTSLWIKIQKRTLW